ncbi:cupin domain-containing protein [Congregibacter brevis]|uniref:Cupin domain-containing protein n=1 Tax=Congregibacter brevis TaxID=3081201 RepID=A0ABZ0IAV3_9GAMM|nr:cupin domain-containing protein [Congregibacter sp. IMCC45268]
MSRPRLQLDVEDFLAKHWQREHLFIPAGFQNFEVPADADELAGLAIEEEVDGRIVSADEGHWHQERGPFTAESYERGGSWSLLVQSVDQYWDETAELLRAVEFLPTWRLDDIMMSYATDGGSAGPHYDNYDVFIIQGEGQRLWQIGGACNASSSLMENTDLRLLSDFEPHHEYLMSCGDVLYVPPGIAHYGTSVGESTSFSIGFRAPRHSDLLARWADNRLNALEDDALFRDPARKISKRSGEITSEDLERARIQLLQLLDQSDPKWFGEAITDVATTHSDVRDTKSVRDCERGWITRIPGSRLAWHASGDELMVFAHGCSHDAPLCLQPLIEALCRNEEVVLEEARYLHDAAPGLLSWLCEEGVILCYE